MIVPIQKSEVEGFKKAAALIDLNVNFFTNENNPYMMSMEISGDVSNSMVFHFTRMAETQNEVINFNEPKHWHLNAK